MCPSRSPGSDPHSSTSASTTTPNTTVSLHAPHDSPSRCPLLRHVRIAESEPYCHSILFVCLSVGHSATYSLPRLIDHNQIWSAGTCGPRTRVSLFGSPVSHTLGARGKNVQNFAYFQRQPFNAYSCHCERDASCHMTCLSVCLSVSMCMCVGNSGEPCKNGSADQDGVLDVDLCKAVEQCISWGEVPLLPPGQYD